jgi:hypothetical protein
MANLRENAVSLLSVTDIADLSGVAQTTLYTVPTGKTCILHSAHLRANADVGANLQVQIGQNGATTDFIASTAGDNLDAQGDVIILAPVPSATPAKLKEYAAATVIEIDVTVGGNAVAGTVYLYGVEDDA